MKYNVLLFVILFILTACSTNTSRYTQKHDSTPTRSPTHAELIDAVPKNEAHSRGGNKNYTVRGKHYKVLPSSKNFKQTGIASWYGNKFHGHLTSNGEIYNMYGMSAAHKNLPLPTYVKVTNNSNNKSVVVRVNDRGPFHESRVIDLSYSAAYKLDMLNTGTANVTIEVINTEKQLSQTTRPLTQSTLAVGYIQMFATKDKQSALSIVKKLKKQFNYSVIMPYSRGIYRVKIGVFNKSAQLESMLEKVKNNGYPKAFKTNSQ